jgi:hypothetical protein
LAAPFLNMDIAMVEPHPRRVLDAFRNGQFDDLEIIGQADEKEFFELCFQEKILAALAESMPTARKKEEVPRWFILAANLSLKLHRENAFSGFERVVRCGGLLQALDPAIASKHLDPQTQRMVLRCQGFNDKNDYERQTPCDQDFLRKVARDVPAQEWQEWFNGPVQQVFQRYGFFDPQGIFIGDASCVFVPDNEAYEGSVLMWFDEHHHPVDYEALDAQARRRCTRRRCYKWVSLLHWRDGAYVYAAVALVPGNAHECPILYELVRQFVGAVGPGVMKWLILDRGFLDGEAISQCKSQLGVEVLLPLRRNMDLWTDAWALAPQAQWQPLEQPVATPAPPPPQRPQNIIRREAKRQQTLAQRKAQSAGPPPPPPPGREVCRLTDFTSWSAASVPLHVTLIRPVGSTDPKQHWALACTTSDLPAPATVQRYGLRTDIEERHRQLKCFYDLTGFRSRSFDAITSQVVFVLLTYTLRQWQLWRLKQTVWAGLTPQSIEQKLAIHQQWIVIYFQCAYVQLPLVTFTRELLELADEARAKALAKVRQLEECLLAPVAPLRPRPP